jgi:hypothetical protein
MTDYNGWTNYATWRVNLEMIDGLEPDDLMTDAKDAYDLGQYFKEYCIDMLEAETADRPASSGISLVLSYAMAFLEDVNWREIAKHMIDAYPDHFEQADPEPFKVLGIDNDGSPTVLAEFDNSWQAKDWARKYVSTENAGNWPQVCVDDTRDECAETIWKWEAEEQEA